MVADSTDGIERFVPPPPDDDATIWRYVDFAKFVALLDTSAIFFPRASVLKDPFEGAFPDAQSVLERVKGMLGPSALPPGATVHFSPGLEQSWQSMRQWTAVSCWHLSPHESVAMWKLYSAAGASVAVRSTVRCLRTALGNPPRLAPGEGGSEGFHIGVVEYIDYKADRIPDGSFAAQFFRKRRSFEHEKELRALFMRFPVLPDRSIDFAAKPSTSGILVPVDLSVLIQGVGVAPGSPAWFAELVERVSAKYGLVVHPTQSELDAVPHY